MTFLPLVWRDGTTDAAGMEIFVLLGTFVLVAVVSILGWTPDTRTGRDWQPRDGWKPFLDLRRPPAMK